ncbi:MAG: Rpn family recombination-promoting nuclease/putative transposase [Synergistaceae bacterium]|nr:Rpn family recombination-promoting nuclease/putative transposase [Synergistaceae bacterium]
MGTKDMTEKYLESYNDVFSDIVNVFFAVNGIKDLRIERPEDLQDAQARTVYKSAGQIREQERDVTKLWVKEDTVISLIGLENQSVIDRTMPLRIFGYEGADYRYQLTQKDRKLNPVFTIVVYFGTSERWPKSRTLFELLRVPDSLKIILNDCRVNVLELAWLTDEQIDLFRSDFKFVARQLKSERTGEAFIPSDERISHPDALLKLMGALTGDQHFTEAVNNLTDFSERGNFTMKSFLTSFLEEAEAKGMAIGEARGIAIGEERVRQSIFQSLLSEGMPRERAAKIVGLN